MDKVFDKSKAPLRLVKRLEEGTVTPARMLGREGHTPDIADSPATQQ